VSGQQARIDRERAAREKADRIIAEVFARTNARIAAREAESNKEAHRADT
jgi:hypothetical protein